MTTEAQVNANRANAQKSTGPRTPEGKEKAAQNALTHGLLAREAVVTGEDYDDFELYRQQFRAELAPVGLAESLLVERIVGLSWRLQRAERFHTEAFDVLYAQCAIDPQSKRWHRGPEPDAADPIVGLTVVKDFSQTKVLERLMMYERRIENSLYRTMGELRQGQRQGAGGVPGTKEEAVRDTHPTDLSREEEDRRGRRSGTVRETLPADFTLDNLLAAIAALEDQPAGATTNMAAAEGKSCETKPICAGPEEEVGRGRPTHEEGSQTRENAFGNLETPDGGTTNLAEAQGQLGETNPISEEVSSLKCQVASETCETNPICVGPGEGQSLCSTGVKSDQAPSGPGETNPILEGVSSLKGQVASETCKTNPICGGGSSRQGGYTPIFRRRR